MTHDIELEVHSKFTGIKGLLCVEVDVDRFGFIVAHESAIVVWDEENEDHEDDYTVSKRNSEKLGEIALDMEQNF